MIALVSLLCILAVASAKPFYVVPTTYTGNLPTPFVFTQPTEVTGTQFRSFVPVQYVTGEYPTPTVFTQPGTPTLKTPVIAQQVVPSYRTVLTPFAPSITRYQTQNTDGSYTFGYSGGPSSRAETRNKYGRVVGVFNYVDPEGKVQTQQYIADDQGFRVAGTNLPVAPYTKTTDTDTNVVTVKRAKRDVTTGYKTPASTVPLKRVYTTTAEVTPRVVYPQPFVQTVPHTYPYNVYPTVYSIPTTAFVQDNTVDRTYEAETVPVPRTYSTETEKFGIISEPKPVTVDTTVPVSVITGKSQPVTYSTNFPFFTYTPTNVVQTVRDDATTGKSQPLVYSGTFPFTTYTPTGFVPTYTDRVVKPTTGYSFYY